jgi:hypothetical protein
VPSADASTVNQGVLGWWQPNINGFGDPETTGVSALEVFNGDLYAGAASWADGARVWRTADGGSWSVASEPGCSSAYTNTNPVVLIWGVL